MKTKRWLGVLIVAGWLTGSAAHGQSTLDQPIFPPPSPLGKNGETTPVKEPMMPSIGGLSDWIVYRRDCCESPVGRRTPLFSEIYLNVGPSIPIGGQTLSRELQTGWSVTGGARALFFNEPLTKAWAFDIHIINTHESAGRHNTPFAVTVFHRGIRTDFGVGGAPGATLQDSNRTLLGMGWGREWYLRRPADDDGCKWRFGIDVGGRWGSHRVDLNEFSHLNDVIASMYTAAHSDLEFLWGRCLFHAGVRVEWAYTWSDILQQTSDVQDLSVLLTVGVRY